MQIKYMSSILNKLLNLLISCNYLKKAILIDDDDFLVSPPSPLKSELLPKL